MDQHIKMHHEFGGTTPQTITMLTGSAAKIYDPEKVQLKGIITAPSEYFQKRSWFIGTEGGPQERCGIDPSEAHVIFNKEERKITLTVNERDKFATVVTGSLNVNKFLSSLAINSAPYTIGDLQKALRFARKWFANPDQHKNLILKLRNFTATITTTTQQENDMAGNKMQLFESKVSKFTQANDLGFTLKLPPFDGVDEELIGISVEIDVINGQVALFLVCDDLDEIEDRIVNTIFEREKEIFKDIVIIEQ